MIDRRRAVNRSERDTMDDLGFKIRGVPVPFASAHYGEVMDFLHHETQLLDDDALDEWLELLSEDVSYLMPVRTTKARREGSGFVDAGYYDDTKTSLTARVKRYTETSSAWVENPPSRSRRFVSNVRVWLADEDRYVRSNYLVLRNRLDAKDYEMLSAERRDLLRPVGDGLKLVKRHIYCDQTLLGTQNLSFIL
jgi:3-phenylpropionate/cinnamic acid dioxygenase small subunit